jgi:hypothetical protein
MRRIASTMALLPLAALAILAGCRSAADDARRHGPQTLEIRYTSLAVPGASAPRVRVNVGVLNCGGEVRDYALRRASGTIRVKGELELDRPRVYVDLPCPMSLASGDRTREVMFLAGPGVHRLQVDTRGDKCSVGLFRQGGAQAAEVELPPLSPWPARICEY